ncbi:hypothetical protein HZ326_22035 [Fusarium oxysporum f. sp. albedinis]|nr:hypothetical protein HZ326_22035 [Fusarium oxysporum f. sp. albedinis]
MIGSGLIAQGKEEPYFDPLLRDMQWAPRDRQGRVAGDGLELSAPPCMFHLFFFSRSNRHHQKRKIGTISVPHPALAPGFSPAKSACGGSINCL